jgi:hypothetical protein
MTEMSEKEKHLLEALLHLLLYLGVSSESSKAIKGLVFTSSTNPPTDYGRPKTMMGG